MKGTSDPTVRTIALSAPASGAPCGLSRAERRTCAELPPHLRAGWRASREAMKRAAAAALRVPEDAIECSPPAAGRPPGIRLREGSGWSTSAPVAASVTHRDGMGAAVVAPAGRSVGIDLERLDDGVAEGAERYFLSASERAEAGSLAAAAVWSLKEAAWKALGRDGATPFRALRLRFDGDSRLTAVELGGKSMSAGADVSTPWPGYILSVVWIEEGSG